MKKINFNYYFDAKFAKVSNRFKGYNGKIFADWLGFFADLCLEKAFE